MAADLHLSRSQAREQGPLPLQLGDGLSAAVDVARRESSAVLVGRLRCNSSRLNPFEAPDRKVM